VEAELLSEVLHAPTTPWPSVRPVPDPGLEAYFVGLRQHRLMIARCLNPMCRTWVHAPLPACPRCHIMELDHEAVSGFGTLYSFTHVHREFTPGLKPPYVAGLIELVEQSGLRVLSNVVGCSPDDIWIGMPLKASFYDYDGFTLAYFRPCAADEART
jgi:uncharacterized OB-fold protein